jgi:predicted Fe-Mo cluster-binding NifX family protein
MKTVITASGNQLTSQFDLRFGRASYFCIYDDSNNEISFVENPNVDATGGAGTKAAEQMVSMEVNRVISGDFGPKAKDLLNQFKIQMVIIQDDSQTIEDLINKLK